MCAMHEEDVVDVEQPPNVLQELKKYFCTEECGCKGQQWSDNCNNPSRCPNCEKK